jgi:hypothetical protein
LEDRDVGRRPDVFDSMVSLKRERIANHDHVGREEREIAYVIALIHEAVGLNEFA